MGRPIIDVSDQTFGRLVVVGLSDQFDVDGSPLWCLVCSVCDGENLRTGSDLRRGRHSCLAMCRKRIAHDSPIHSLYSTYQRNAAKSGREFDLPFEWFADAIKNDCHYCYSPPIMFHKKSGSREGVTYNGIDRVNSAGGYTKDNVVTCCKFCNFAKGRWDAEEFLSWLDRVRCISVRDQNDG